MPKARGHSWRFKTLVSGQRLSPCCCDGAALARAAESSVSRSRSGWPRRAAGRWPHHRSGHSAGRLRLIAPRGFNPTGEACLPVLHANRGARRYTALFSNTARAHRAGKTRDWVVLYSDDRTRATSTPSLQRRAVRCAVTGSLRAARASVPTRRTARPPEAVPITDAPRPRAH